MARYLLLLLLLLLGERAFALVPGNWSATGSQYGDVTVSFDTPPSIVLPSGSIFTYVHPLIQTYSPTTGGWTVINGTYNISIGAECCLLFTGKVLCSGGFEEGYGSTLTTLVWTYDPTNNLVVRAADMNTARINHAIVAIPSGAVVFAGTTDTSVTYEVYNTNTDTWTQQTLWTNEYGIVYSVGTYLGFGDAVLFSGGLGIVGGVGVSGIDSAFLYINGSIHKTPANMTSTRIGHSAILLSNATVLVVGGETNYDPISTAEIYSFSTNTFNATTPMNDIRTNFGLAQLAPNYFVAAGGYNTVATTNTVEVFYAPNKTWTLVTPMITARAQFQLVPLPGGKLLAAGGTSDFEYHQTLLSEVYNQSSSFTAPDSAPVFIWEAAPTPTPTATPSATPSATTQEATAGLSVIDGVIIGVVVASVMLLVAGMGVLFRVRFSSILP